MDELIDIYDEEGNPLGFTMKRKEAHLPLGQFKRYVLAIIQNLDGKVLISQRALDKGWAAGWWEIPGGGVGAGETPDVSVVREVEEETGLNVNGVVPRMVYEYKNIDEKHGDNYFMSIYHLVLPFTDADIHMQAEESIGYKLATWDDIDSLGAQGIFLHYERLKQARSKM